MLVGVLLDVRHASFPELGGSYTTSDTRLPWFRMLRTQSLGIATDFGILNRAMPFLDRFEDRSALTLVLSGTGRFDAADRHDYLRAGELVLSAGAAGTEAYVGESLSIEWDPKVLGLDLKGQSIECLSGRDLQRVTELVARLNGPQHAEVVVGIMNLLRAAGLGVDRFEPGELRRDDEGESFQRMQSSISARLSALHEFPTIQEIALELGWDERRVHRQMEQLRARYRVVWRHWRELVHQARLLRATQLLSVPGATTEIVARLSGFRSPSALCHAFARVNLPSPGRLSSLARSNPLLGYSELAA